MAQPDRYDRVSGCQTVLHLEHSEIHEGEMFEMIGVVQGLAGGASVYRGITIPSGVAVHLKPMRMASTASGILLTLHKDTNYTGGTPVTPINRKVDHAADSTLAIYSLVTPGALGPLYDWLMAGSGGTPATSRGGGSEGSDDEIYITLPGSWVLKLTNIGSTTTDVYFAQKWYEEVF